MLFKKNSMKNFEINDDMLEDFTNFENMMFLLKPCKRTTFMKKLLIFFLLVFSIGKLSAQFSTMFNDTVRAFGSGGDGFDCVIQDDSAYYVGGFINNANGQYPYVIRLNLNGQIIKKSSYNDSVYDYALYPYNSMVIKDTSLLFCGQKIGASSTFGFITSINKYNLDTQWTQTYTHPDTIIAQTASDVFSVLTAIKATPDGGYILTGNYNKNCITGNLRSFLMKIDSIGNVEWRRTYSTYYTFFDIEIAQDSGYFVPSGLNGTNNLQLVKFNKVGIYQWKVGTTTNPMAGYPLSVALQGANYAIVASKYLYDVSNFLSALVVTKVNLITKSVVWEKSYYTYKSFDCFTVNQAMGVETLADGSIIVSGSANRYGHDAVILKLNSNGDSLWCKSYDFEPDPWDCQLNDLIVTDDGGFMGVGFWSDQNGPGWTAWMFKTDSNGVVGFESSNFERSKLKVYPNPASSYINFELPKNLKQKSTLTIFNALGQEVYSSKISTSSSTYNLNLKSFKAGVYFYELYSDGKVLGKGKFLKVNNEK